MAEQKKREKRHVFNLWPHIYELEDMLDFCGKYQHIYIYGRGFNSEMLLKYFDNCGIQIDGYVVSRRNVLESPFCYRELPVRLAEEVMREPDTGFVVALSDRHYHGVVPRMRDAGFLDYFLMTEFNKNAIADQMTVRSKQDMTFEISLADHCNMSCQMCDHYSQLSDPWFVDLESYQNDMHQMGKIYDHEVGAISLLGGEPTLHPDINELIQITRTEFPDSELIVLTNGVLLTKMEDAKNGNFWATCRDNNVHITVTVYPINLDYQAIEQKAKEYNVPLALSSNIHAERLTRIPKVSDKHTMDPSGSVPKFYFVNCLYFNKFNVLKDGKLYMCPVAAHIDILNKRFGTKFAIREGDYLDIYQVKDWHEFAEFTARRVPFCDYCDLKHWGPHSVWKNSTKKIDEYL